MDEISEIYLKYSVNKIICNIILSWVQTLCVTTVYANTVQRVPEIIKMTSINLALFFTGEMGKRDS